MKLPLVSIIMNCHNGELYATMVLCLKIWKSRTLPGLKIMKIASSLKSLKKRDLNSKLVKRRGKLYVINKKNPKFKARQG